MYIYTQTYVYAYVYMSVAILPQAIMTIHLALLCHAWVHARGLHLTSRAWTIASNIHNLDHFFHDGAGMTGCCAPYDAQVMDVALNSSQSSGQDKMEIQFGVNFFCHSMLRTVKPYVPLYRSCVCELAEAITPVMSRNPIVVHCGLLKGDLLPRGDLLCISHALLHKVASEIESGSDAELKPWLRMLLSIPCIFNSLPYEDLQYVLANSLQMDATNMSRAVGCQTIYNVHPGWKAQERLGAVSMNAQAIADFWREHMRIGAKFAMAAVTLQNICSQKLMVHAGGTRSDVVGPGIPKMKLPDKIDYYCKRRVSPGGKLEDEAENDGAEYGEDTPQTIDTDAEGDLDETQDIKPINFHVLPVTVVTDYVQGFGVKYVTDVLTNMLFGCKNIDVRYERELGVSCA